MADTRLVVRVVGAPVGAKLTEPIRRFIRHLSRPHPVNGISARFLADCHKLVADFIDGDVPRYALPLPAGELHRIFKATLARDEFTHRGAFRAMRAAIDRQIPARLLADPDAVRHFGGNGAADRTMCAYALADSGTGDIGNSSFRLPHGRKRQCANGGKTARHQSGFAQESAAIDTADSLVADHRYEIAAMCLTFGSFDQHDCISLTSDNG